MPLDSAVLDFHALGVSDTPAGPRQKVVLVAARREMVERFVTAVRGAGLRPEGVDLSAFAMIRALVPPAVEGAHPVLLLSVSGLTNLVVAGGRVCHFTRVVGAGLESMALELAERRAITLDEAHRTLASVGAAPSEDDGDELASDARSVLRDGVRRIATEVRNSLDFHRAQEESEPVHRALLTGAAADVPGFADALSAELELPVEVAVVPRSGDAGAVSPGRLTVAAGLAAEEAPR